MGLLSDFFITHEAEVPAYDGGMDFPDADRAQFKGITPLEAEGLLAALRGAGDSDEADRVSLMKEFTLLSPQDANCWTMGVPDDFTSRLAALDDSTLPDVAERFAAITIEELGCTDEDARPMIAELAELAKKALAEGKRMYLWICL